jgi:hypothetical protein
MAENNKMEQTSEEQILIDKQDYVLPKDSSVWITVGNYSVKVSHLFIDVFELGKELDEPINRMYIN